MSLRLIGLRAAVPLFAFAFAAALPGCNSGSKPVTMADSFDLDIFGPHVDDLHTPYVAGADFAITVSASDSQQTQNGWTLSSSNPNVLRVTSPLSGGSANVQAANAGQATVSVLDATGKVIDSHPVTVEIPDQVNLYAEGQLLTGAPDSVAQVTAASIVSGGEATFLVRYFAQGTELYGSGALQSTATNGITTGSASESFATARDFLQVTVPANDGASGSVSLLIDDVSVGEVPITTVNASAVTQVSILSQSAAGASSGTSLTLYAHAVDATAADVYGASFDWSIVGQTDGGQPTQGFSSGPADLFFYNYDAAATETVIASYDGFSPSATVHGQGGSVGSTANVGCSIGVAPGTPSGGGVPGIIVAIALGGIAAAAGRRRGGACRLT
jgi:hypothetical protein